MTTAISNIRDITGEASVSMCYAHIWERTDGDVIVRANTMMSGENRRGVEDPEKDVSGDGRHSPTS